MALGWATRRLVKSLQARTDAATNFVLRIGTVSTATAGSSLDGVTTVVVAVNGSTQLSPWVEAYSDINQPHVNDRVVVALIDNSPIVLGKLVGLPSY